MLMGMITPRANRPWVEAVTSLARIGFVANDFRICYIEVVLQRIGILGASLADIYEAYLTGGR
jgi:hypothetical protein